MISTRDLSGLPDIESLRARLQQLAVLDRVMGCPGGGTYQFHAKWAREEQMAKYDDESGDELYVHFTPAGCFIKGFAHESEMSPYQSDPPKLWPGLFVGVPREFQSSLDEPAFEREATTFVVWRLAGAPEWQTSKVEYPDHYYGDGSADLLATLVMSSDEFAEWLEENYEIEIDAEVIADVFDGQPLTDERLRALNPEANLAELRRTVQDCGYSLG